MRPLLFTLLLPALLFADMLTPTYYSGELKEEVDTFLAACPAVKMHHPLENPKGKIPNYTIPFFGTFGAGKGPPRTEKFYGFRQTQPGSKEWPYGKWDPDCGYGFGEPESHELELAKGAQ